MNVVKSIKILAEELARYNYELEKPLRLSGHPSPVYQEEEYRDIGINLILELSKSPIEMGEEIIQKTTLKLAEALCEIGDFLHSTREERWKSLQPSVFNFDLNEININEFKLIESLNIITEELIESGTRCSYLYDIRVSTLSIPPGSIPGFQVEIWSEVYGEIATAMEESLLFAFLKMGDYLMNTRIDRWEYENNH